MKRLLIANRGEIAIRIARAAADMGIETIAIFAEDDAKNLHTKIADQAIALSGKGAKAYLDIDQIVAVAKGADVDAIHPGYGFLSENPVFAAAVEAAGMIFVGPTPDMLTLFGDKTSARALAQELDVLTLPGTTGETSLKDAKAFLKSKDSGGAIMIKALAGGGGRGMRVVTDAADLEDAYAQAAREAEAAFGNGALYVEAFMPAARHIEVQIIGDGQGGVTHLWERDCSLQRRHQKVVEIAPSPNLSPKVRDHLIDAALKMASHAGYRSLGTFEFLVEAGKGDDARIAFIEANPRLQVEHTVTEEVTGIDLVQTQLAIADGKSISDVGLTTDPAVPQGHAIQLRINMESLVADGSVRPSGGVISAFDMPSGPGLRSDTFGYAGYRTSPSYDSLLAKLIVHHRSSDFGDCVRRAARALSETRIEGVKTGIPFLQNVLAHDAFIIGDITTRFVDQEIAALAEGSAAATRHFTSDSGKAAKVGAAIQSDDPLAVLDHGRAQQTEDAADDEVIMTGPEGTTPVPAPMQGSIMSVDVSAGDEVRAGAPLLLMDAMKMEHVIEAPISGRIAEIAVEDGDTIYEGHPLLFIEPMDVAASGDEASEEIDLDEVRPDLQDVLDRQAKLLDENRPNAVARRVKTNQRTARQNVDDLMDDGSMIEYGGLTIAAQRRRREMQDLIDNTPTDGLICGVGSINGDRFGDDKARAMVMAYDYTVLAGTQGIMNHKKTDRMLDVAEAERLPIVFFTEGGGGRPGDTDGIGVAGLDVTTFAHFGRMSGKVPLIGINSGRCFAGNAALLGCCDVVIATKNSTIGMGGPAMIEGGGLGIFKPEEVGPMSVQTANGVVDIAVEDEAEAVTMAKKYLSYIQGPVDDWTCADQRLLRRAIPENRLRVYDIRELIGTLVDDDSFLELRKDFGLAMITGFARIEGKPFGLIANNPGYLSGAIDPDAADKAARFMRLCDAYNLPILNLCDTPGIMVGPETEKRALVRHAARMFVTSANVSVPCMTIILRKAYGLGAQAMAAGSFRCPFFTIAWPTGEFGGMGLEGAVKLGYRKELEAKEDPAERKELYDSLVEGMYQRGKALPTATLLEIDNVIDPMESRKWIARGLASFDPDRERNDQAYVDTW